MSGTQHVVILHATYTLRATLCCSLLQGIAVCKSVYYTSGQCLCAGFITSHFKVHMLGGMG